MDSEEEVQPDNTIDADEGQTALEPRRQADLIVSSEEFQLICERLGFLPATLSEKLNTLGFSRSETTFYLKVAVGDKRTMRPETFSAILRAYRGTERDLDTLVKRPDSVATRDMINYIMTVISLFTGDFEISLGHSVWLTREFGERAENFIESVIDSWAEIVRRGFIRRETFDNSAIGRFISIFIKKIYPNLKNRDIWAQLEESADVEVFLDAYSMNEERVEIWE